MDKANFLECLDELLELPSGTIVAGDPLEGYGWDSVATIGFLSLADEKFGHAPSPAQLVKCQTAEDLMALFPGRIAA